jgi:peptide chain release factor subunit 1
MEVTMLSESDLRELIVFSAASPVLSVYLSTEPSEGNADAWKLRLRTMLKEVDLPQDTAAVENYFNREHNWSGRGAAVFSCANEDFFRAYALGLSVRNQVNIGSHPSINQLTELLENYGGYGVVLIDKQGARVFHFHMGELREQEGTAGEIVRHTRLGGINGSIHDEEEVVDRNMREAVDFTVRFFESKHIRRILLCGTEENVATFKTFLPKKWAERVVGSFSANMLDSHAEILAKTIQIGRQVELERENKLIEDLIASAAKGVGASVGLEPTLEAISSSRVQTLLVSQGFNQPIQRCLNCGQVTTKDSKKCTACDGKLEKVADGVEMAVNSVMRNGGEVEIVAPTPEFTRAGSIGAYLRY